MDISHALNFFHVWHTAYANGEEDHNCPSRLWIQYLTQELLQRMLPYVEITVEEEIRDREQTEKEEQLWQSWEPEKLFEVVRAMMLDMMQRIALLVYRNVLGYETNDTAVAVAAMNSEELEHYGAHCTITFLGLAYTSLVVTKEKTCSDQAAPMTRYLLFGLQHLRPELPVHCQYRVPEVTDVAHTLLCQGYSSGAMDEVVDSILERVDKEHSNCVYLAAAEYWNHAFVVRYSMNTPFQQPEREQDFCKESCWASYCQRLCSQCLAVAYHTLIGDIQDLTQQPEIMMPEWETKRKHPDRDKEEEEEEESKRQKQ